MKIGRRNGTRILPKFEISIFQKFRFEKCHPKSKFHTPKPWFRFRIWDLASWNPFSKIQNRFLHFLSNLVSRPKNLKSPSSKTPKYWFSLQHSHFRFKYFFYRNPKFRIRSTWTSIGICQRDIQPYAQLKKKLKNISGILKRDARENFGI